MPNARTRSPRRTAPQVKAEMQRLTVPERAPAAAPRHAETQGTARAARDGTPARDDTPIRDDTPVRDDTPARDGTPIRDQTPARGDTPDAEAIRRMIEAAYT